MAQLPTSLTFPQMITRWASLLNPIISNPITNAGVLVNVQLQVGDNSIPHLLQRKMQGWFIVDINGVASIYRSQPFNASTLTLNSSAVVIINVGVF